MFKKTIPNRIFQDLVDQIQEAIIDGRLKPGDKLPSQRELGEMFQTSRATLREALRVLEHKGLIEMKLGVSGGAVVKDPNTQHITEGLNLLMQYQKVNFDHLAEFREVVEGNVAGLAAERADKGDIRRLKNFLKEAESHLSDGKEGWKPFLRVDVQFHIALAEISGNPLFKAVLQMIHENILDVYVEVSPEQIDMIEESYRTMCEIVEAIEGKQVKRAESLSRIHVRKFNEYLKKEGE